MKYIKKFSTSARYNTFINGGEYVTPNICYIEENNDYIVKPKSKSFFTVRDTRTNIVYGPFYFDEGMTASDYIESTYMDEYPQLRRTTGNELSISIKMANGSSGNFFIVRSQELIEAKEYTVNSGNGMSGGEPATL